MESEEARERWLRDALEQAQARVRSAKERLQVQVDEVALRREVDGQCAAFLERVAGLEDALVLRRRTVEEARLKAMRLKMAAAAPWWAAIRSAFPMVGMLGLTVAGGLWARALASRWEWLHVPWPLLGVVLASSATVVGVEVFRAAKALRGKTPGRSASR